MIKSKIMKHLILLISIFLFLYFPLSAQFEVNHVFHTTALGQSTASGNNSTAMGKSTASGFSSTAMGESTASINHSTAMGLSNASNGYSTAMGESAASGNYSTAMGESITSLNHSTAMGKSNASGFRSTAMGESTASTNHSTAMGLSTASGNYSTAMGESITSKNHSTAMGKSTASGFRSTAMGESTASGDYSVAMGRNVNTNGFSGAFFFGDDDPILRTSADVNQFVCRFKGGYYFISGFTDPMNSAGDLGVRVPVNGNSWVSISDKNRKENFNALDDEEVIEKLSSVTFGSWNYKGLDPQKDRHYGIMAQDFYRLFGHDELGTIGCDTLVNPIDMIGITMSAIKGLKVKFDAEKNKVTEDYNTMRQEYQNKLEQQQTQIEALTKDVALLKTLLLEKA